jgi:hypothetical protein
MASGSDLGSTLCKTLQNTVPERPSNRQKVYHIIKIKSRKFSSNKWNK